MARENICFQLIIGIVSFFVKISDDFTIYYKNEYTDVDGRWKEFFKL